jgi:hypothetical protein
MSEFHCVIQAKGGIGKSLVASWFAQYLRSRTVDPLCVECDASNKTLSRYSGLRVKRIDLLDEDRRINRRRFDELFEVLLGEEEKAVVVDNGQGSFEPLAQYLLEMDAVRQLKAAGRQTFLHCVITGGQHGPSTLAGLGTIAKFLVEDSTLVVWQNEHFGPVDLERVRELTRPCSDRLIGPVVMVRRGHTFQEDVQEMLSRFMTFDEAIAGDHFRTPAKSRLSMVRTDLFTEIEHALEGA